MYSIVVVALWVSLLALTRAGNFDDPVMGNATLYLRYECLENIFVSSLSMTMMDKIANFFPLSPLSASFYHPNCVRLNAVRPHIVAIT
jgi:hypothetical protein